MPNSLRFNRGVIVGGGIAGLTLALALGQRAQKALGSLTLWERAPRFEEVGAGLQLGPNASGLLIRMGLGPALARIGSQPVSLAVCNALRTETLATKPLGSTSAQQYGAPYTTVHRADLHQLLLEAVQREGWAQLALNRELTGIDQGPDGALTLRAKLQGDELADPITTDLLLGCDGGFSQVRALLLADGPPAVTGQVAFRALLPLKNLNLGLTGQCVSVWLGPDMHTVGYPVRAGDLYNLVVILQVPLAQVDTLWEQRQMTSKLPLRTPIGHKTLAQLVDSVEQWRSWALFDRPPVSQSKELVPHPSTLLLGDAAHPMLPFLAQGAAMSIEDAWSIAQGCATLPANNKQTHHPSLAQHYVQQRQARVAKVQAGARRNAKIFHANGPLAVARNLALKVNGRALLDRPWLYGYRPD
jgi:salicylate hydroxylase